MGEFRGCPAWNKTLTAPTARSCGIRSVIECTAALTWAPSRRNVRRRGSHTHARERENTHIVPHAEHLHMCNYDIVGFKPLRTEPRAGRMSARGCRFAQNEVHKTKQVAPDPVAVKGLPTACKWSEGPHRSTKVAQVTKSVRET
jgi:hypothetical protein